MKKVLQIVVIAIIAVATHANAAVVEMGGNPESTASTTPSTQGRIVACPPGLPLTVNAGGRICRESTLQDGRIQLLVEQLPILAPYADSSQAAPSRAQKQVAADQAAVRQMRRDAEAMRQRNGGSLSRVGN